MGNRSATFLLTGSTGFVGSNVLAALRDAGAGVRRLVRRPTRQDGDLVAGGVEDPQAITIAMQGVSSVIHCASYVGADPRKQQQVNVEGTRSLLTEAKNAGVSQFICLSTSGVYGGSLGQGLAEGAIPVQPQSPLSQSRSDAENLVLEAGGTVVRPNIIYGPGDRRTITVLLRAMADLNAWIGDPDALISAIPVEQLGRLIASLATTNAGPGIYHAALPEPIPLDALLTPIYQSANAKLPMRLISPELANQLYPDVSARQFGMIATDNWYNSNRIWEATRIPAPPTTMTSKTSRYYGQVLQQALKANQSHASDVPGVDGALTVPGREGPGP